MTKEEIIQQLSGIGLKITPQRMVILEAIHALKHHPTADDIINYIKRQNLSIAKGTVYKILHVLVEKELIAKVRTEEDVMRFDGRTDHHHHLYDATSEMMEDYTDEELDELLRRFFKGKNLPDFTIEEMSLQIKGTFKE